jgi:Sec-independent protein translocase protein TatA
MFDFGLSYTHMLVLGVIAFLVIGKEDMPVVLRRFGQFMAKVRAMSREFQGHVDLAMKDAGVADLKSNLQGLKSQVDTVTKSPFPSDAKVAEPSYRVREFEKLFVAGQVGETRVAGTAIEVDQASKA